MRPFGTAVGTDDAHAPSDATQEAETQLQHASGALTTHSKHRKFGFLRRTSRSAIVGELDGHRRAGEGTRHSLDLFDAERHDETAGRVWITSWIASSAVDPAEAAAEAAQVPVKIQESDVT